MSGADVTSRGAETKTRYETGFDDPEADVVLESEDNKLFRVHSYYLKANSAFFRAMPTPHEAPPDSAQNPVITIAGPAESLARLLDLVSAANPRHFERWSQVKPVLALGARYQFENLSVRLLPIIGGCLRHDAWSVFAFASQHDFHLLAKQSIKGLVADTAIGLNSSTFVETMECHWFDKVTSRYTAALLKAMARNQNRHTVSISWEDVSRDFEV